MEKVMGMFNSVAFKREKILSLSLSLLVKGGSYRKEGSPDGFNNQENLKYRGAEKLLWLREVLSSGEAFPFMLEVKNGFCCVVEGGVDKLVPRDDWSARLVGCFVPFFKEERGGSVLMCWGGNYPARRGEAGGASFWVELTLPQRDAEALRKAPAFFLVGEQSYSLGVRDDLQKRAVEG